MVQHEIKIHDKKQFELKLHYNFRKERRKGEYFIETYFFVPNVLGINRHSFHKKNFYDSIKNYIRFATPKFTLAELSSDEKSPIIQLSLLAKKAGERNSPIEADEIEAAIKLFSVVFAATIRTDFLNFRGKKKDALRSELTNFLLHTDSVINLFRDIQSKMERRPRVKEVFAFADEYISLVIEKYLFMILDEHSGFFEEGDKEIENNIYSFIKGEVNRRKEKGYRSVVKIDSSNEEMLFRFSTLKKYFSSILSLERDVEREGTILEQLLFSLAAGMAMLFATAVAFWGQTTFGNLTMSFFIVLVVSYMFKDRIKELLREIMKKSVFKYLFDYKYILYIDEKIKIGIIRESFDFIKRRKLPERIMKLRNLYRTKEFDNNFQKEKIILYRKKINLKSKFLNKIEKEELKTISDIFRFDVSRFLNKMDDPHKPLYVLTDSGFKKIFGRRVYHVNLILRIVRDNREQLKRFRLVLTKNGIERIEHVAAE